MDIKINQSQRMDFRSDQEIYLDDEYGEGSYVRLRDEGRMPWLSDEYYEAMEDYD